MATAQGQMFGLYACIFLLWLVKAGFNDGGFVFLLIFVENDQFAAVDGEFDLGAYRDIGRFRPREVELLAGYVGLLVALNGVNLVSVGIVGGVGGGVLGVLSVFSLGVGIVGGGAAFGDFLLLGIDEFAGVPLTGRGCEGHGAGKQEGGGS